MRNFYFVLISFTLIFFRTEFGYGQVATGYVWSQSNNTYTPLVADPNTTPALFSEYWDDVTSKNYTLPFDFYYNGVVYPAGSTIGLDSDAWITFDQGTMTGTTGGGSWISASNSTGVYLNGTGNNNGFAGFNVDLKSNSSMATFTGNLDVNSYNITNVSNTADLTIGTRLYSSGNIASGTVVTAIAGNTVTMSAKPLTTTNATTIQPYSSIYAKTIGTAPNRKFVIQWTQCLRYVSTGLKDNFSFQMILNEGGGLLPMQTLQVMYGRMFSDQPGTNKLGSQVGLRGNSNADFNARKSDINENWNTTVAATNNADLVFIYDTKFPAPGLTYTWAPVCTGLQPDVIGDLTGPTPVCPGSTNTYNFSALFSTVPATFYKWTYSNPNGTLASAITSSPTNSITFSTNSGSTSGVLTITPANICGDASAATLTINVNNASGGSATYPSAGSCATTGTITPTINGTTGGTFSAIPSGLSINPTTGAINLATSGSGSFIVEYTVNNNGCTIKSTTAFTKQGVPDATITSNLGSMVCSGANGQLQTNAYSSGGYSLSSITYYTLSSTTKTVIFNNGEDEAKSSVTIPFNFNFYGNTYNSVSVSSNGFVSLGDNSNSLTAQTLPSTTTPNGVIALCWADLKVDPTVNAGANVSYFTYGSAPNRIFVIEYTGVRFYSNSTVGTGVTGQIHLFEGSNIIDIVIASVNSGTSTTSRTTGIENATGTVGLSPVNYNNANWSASNLGWRYMPSASLTYNWSPSTYLSSTSIYNPNVTNITSSVTYNLTVTDPSTGCTSTASYPINITTAPTLLSTTAGETCGSGAASLSATGSGTSTVNWYTNATGGSPIATGNNFTTPIIYVPTTYYAEAYGSASCIGPRTAVLANVKNYVSPISVTLSGGSICVSGALTATASGGVSPSNQTTAYTQLFDGNNGSLDLTATTLTRALNNTYFSQGTKSVLLTQGTSTTGYYTVDNAINLSGAAQANISFAQICALEGTSFSYDYGYLQYSSDGGTTWVDFPASSYAGSGTLLNGTGFSTRSYQDWINTFTTSTSTPNNSLWKNETFLIPAGALTANFKFRFKITTDGSTFFYGWLIDNLKITKYDAVQSPLTWSPTTGLYTTSALTTAYGGEALSTVYANPSATTNYTVTATGADGCQRSSQVTVNVLNPQLTSTTPGTRCGSGTVTLAATAGTGNTINWFTAATGGVGTSGASYTTPAITATTTYYAAATYVAPSSATLGAGASALQTDYVNPFYYLWGAQKRQYLIRASELTAAGITAGNILSLAMEFTTSANQAFNGFTISMGNTTTTAFGTSWLAANTQVYSVGSTTPTVGVNTYTFSTPFGWDGTSNVVVQICWGNNNLGSSSNSPTVKYDGVGFSAMMAQRADNLTAAGICSYSSYYETQNNRPKFILGMNGANCTGTRTPVVATIKTAGVWAGVNSNWNDPVNWCFSNGHTVPDITDNVTIPTGVAFYPIITDLVPTCRQITMKTGSSITILNGGQLQSGGVFVGDAGSIFNVNAGGKFIFTSTSITNNGSFVVDGRIMFNAGTTVFPAATSTGTMSPINELEINASTANLTVSKPITISGALIPTSGKLTLNSDITLASSASKTAYVDKISSFTIVYNSTFRFKVERHLNVGARRWQLLATPVQAEKKIKETWMESGVNNNGYGTIITGTTGTTGGFDAASPLPAMKIYQPLTDAYLEVGNPTTTDLTNLQGYMLYVRGNRTIMPTPLATSIANLRSIGKIYTGDVTMPLVPVGKWQTLGNPYPSPVDMGLFFQDPTNTSLKHGFTAWDPYLAGTYGAGAFVAMSETNNWVATVSTPSYSTSAVNNNKIIQSSQAIFVENTSTASVTPVFKETMKATLSRTVLRPGDNDGRMFFRMQVVAPNGKLTDGNATVFGRMYDNAVGKEDLRKVMNLAENFGLRRDGYILSIEGRKPLHKTDTIFLNVSAVYNGDYTLRFAPQNMEGIPYTAELVDKYNNTRTMINLDDSSSTTVNFNADALSKANDRLYIVFNKTKGQIARFINTYAKNNGTKNMVSWMVSPEIGIEEYFVERSATKENFERLKIKTASTNSSTTSKYEVLDEAPLAGDNYYRIVAKCFDGENIISTTVKIGASKEAPIVQISPNPITNGKLHILSQHLAKGIYTVNLLTNNGQIVHTAKFDQMLKAQNHVISLPNTLVSGKYTVVIAQDKQTIFSEQVIVE